MNHFHTCFLENFLLLIFPFAALIITPDGYRLHIAVFRSVRLVTIFLLFFFLERASRTYRLRRTNNQLSDHVEESHSVSLRGKPNAPTMTTNEGLTSASVCALRVASNVRVSIN